MSSIIARTGRHHQRYEDNLRLVSGCIPYRLVKNDEGHCTDLESRIEVLMISSSNRDDLVFPKGGWDDDETKEEAAEREALEEAGVRGILKEKLGVWEFRSKSSQEIGSPKAGCRGHIFALKVTEELDTWPEQGNHGRKWLYINEAFKHCRYEWMCLALEKLKVVLEDSKHEMNKEASVRHPVPVSNVDECQKKSISCYVKPSSAQNHDFLGWLLGLVQAFQGCTSLEAKMKRINKGMRNIRYRVLHYVRVALDSRVAVRISSTVKLISTAFSGTSLWSVKPSWRKHQQSSPISGERPTPVQVEWQTLEKLKKKKTKRGLSYHHLLILLIFITFVIGLL